MIKSKKQMFTVIGVFAVFLMLTTVTYAFFNYTRTGVANNIRTGRIYFNSTQNGTLNLTNLFPVASNEVGNSNQIEVRVYGDTTYVGGEEFEISLVSVNNTIVSGSTEKTIPVNYIATYTATPVATEEDPNNIGTSSNDYFNDRGSATAVYKLKASGEVTEGEQVLVGYIPKDVAIDGTLTIKAYLDRSNIAISDTYDETSPETDYNGTTEKWVNGRVLLTTTEWNTLQNTPISFKIKSEANEGTWVEEPVAQGTIASCPGCKFVYPYDTYYYGTNGSLLTAIDDENIYDIYDDYRDLVEATTDFGFFGVIEEDGKIERVFTCGVIEGNAFCLEATNDESIVASNIAIMQALPNNNCSMDEYDNFDCICQSNDCVLGQSYAFIGSDFNLSVSSCYVTIDSHEFSCR